MANMNKKRQAPRMNKTLNHEGAVVHKLDALEALFSKTLGSFFGESTHYEKRSAESDYNKLVDLIEQVHEDDKEYVLKIAELGRKHNMISYPLEILTACSNMERYKGMNFLDPEHRKSKLAYYSDVIVRRTLDVTEILATQVSMYDFDKKKQKTKRTKMNNKRNRNVPLPMQLRKNLRAKLESFDAFKLSKGLSENKLVTLKDAFCLLRPAPADKKLEKVYKDIMNGTLSLGAGKAQIRTELSKKGQTLEKGNIDLKEAVYKGTLQNILYSLRSLYDNGVFKDKEVLAFVCNKFRNEKEVLNSKLLPFRFYSAYKELNFANSRELEELREAITDALDLSVANVDNIDGTTGVLVDVSASMRVKISNKSSVTSLEIACLLGAIAYKKGFGDLFDFGTRCERADFSRRTPLIEMTRILTRRVNFIGGGTDLHRALACITSYAEKNKIKYDNLIILSDNDCYGYDTRTNTLTFGELCGWLPPNADEHAKEMMSKGIVKKFWINNLQGNDFAIINTANHSKNLITGYSEKFINIIDVYNYIGGVGDIRKVIDELLVRMK